MYVLLTQERMNVRILYYLVNPQRACAARVTVVVLSVCLSVCLSVRASSRTAGYEVANEWHQRVVNNENMDINVAIFLKRLRSREKAKVRSIAHEPSLAGYIARTRHVN